MQASGSRLIACTLKHLFCSLFPIFFHFKPDRRTPIRRSLLFSFILSSYFFSSFPFWASLVRPSYDPIRPILCAVSFLRKTGDH